MKAYVGKIISLMDARERKRALGLFLLILVMAFFEVAGVASILPFMSVMSDPDKITTNNFLSTLYQLGGFSSHNQFIVVLGLVVFLQLLIASAFKALTTWATLRFSHGLNHELANRLFGNYLQRPYEWFLTQNTSDLGKAMLAEVNQVVLKTLIPLLQIISQGFLCVVLISLLVFVDFKTAITVSLSVVLIYLVLYLLFSERLSYLGRTRILQNRQRFVLTQEALSGIKDLKILGIEGFFLNRFRNASRSFADIEVANQTIMLLPRYGLEALGFGGLLLLALYLFISHGGLSEALPIVALYAVAGYRLLPALQLVYQHSSTLRFSKPVLDLLHNDLNVDLGSPDRPWSDRHPPRPLKGLLELRDVSYRYPTAVRPTVQQLTVKIAANTTVAFVGATGSGKTSAVDLIMGLLEPTGGDIVVDGEVLKPEELREWRRNFGYVQQHIFLSDDTVAANIAFGLVPSEIDQAAVERAAKAAKLHDFVASELAEGYDTMVGERGVRLSGGQRQRLGIARALYHGPDILVFDEATNALDNVTERLVMDAIRDLKHTKTIILVAHRLTTVQHCDEIFLLEGGKVVASGSYDDMMENSSEFRYLAKTEESAVVKMEQSA